MTKPSTDLARYLAAASKRQIILEYLWNRAEPATATEIAAATGIPRISLLNILRKLYIALEVKKTDRKMTAPWIALVRKTRDGESLMRSAHSRSTAFARESRENVEREANPSAYIGGRLVHKVGSNDRPVANQGGQGGGTRPRMNSCMG